MILSAVLVVGNGLSSYVNKTKKCHKCAEKICQREIFEWHRLKIKLWFLFIPYYCFEEGKLLLSEAILKLFEYVNIVVLLEKYFFFINKVHRGKRNLISMFLFSRAMILNFFTAFPGFPSYVCSWVWQGLNVVALHYFFFFGCIAVSVFPTAWGSFIITPGNS